MKKMLADPTAPKQKKNGMYPWDYAAPTKDQSHSGFLSAGNDYGTGHRNPVGKDKASSYDSGPIPQQSKCFSPNEIFKSEDKRG
jgi:hypothetical protein